MRSIGQLHSISKDMEGNLLVTFAIEDSQEAEEGYRNLEGKELVIESKKYSPRRSLSANSYLWRLCDLIAEKLNTDKDTVYLIMLSRYGLFSDLMIASEAVSELKRMYRFVEIIEDNGTEAYCRCYIGSHTYNQNEMSRLLDGVVQEAKDIGVEVWTQDEISHLLALIHS